MGLWFDPKPSVDRGGGRAGTPEPIRGTRQSVQVQGGAISRGTGIPIEREPEHLEPGSRSVKSRREEECQGGSGSNYDTSTPGTSPRPGGYSHDHERGQYRFGQSWLLGDPRNGILRYSILFFPCGSGNRYQIPVGSSLGADTFSPRRRGFTAENRTLHSGVHGGALAAGETRQPHGP